MNLSAILAQTTAPPQQPNFSDLLRGPLVPMLIVMFGFLYIMNRSQKKKVREHEEMVKTLKSGDKVLTNGGIIGVVVTVKEKSLTLRSADSKMEITKSAVGNILERSGESAES